MPEEKPGSCVERGEGPRTEAVFDASALDSRIITRFFIEKCRAASQVLRRSLPTIAEYCDKHRAAGRMWPIWNDVELYPMKLLELWGILNREKPQRILELGTGCTTAVFSLYCQSHFCTLTTVDENSDFQAAVCSDIWAGEITRVHSKVKRWENFCEYSGLDRFASLDFDFIYVDGPTNAEGGKFQICRDVAKFYPRLSLFDIRRETVAYMQKELHEYSWELSCWQESGSPWYLSRFQHHTIARRRA